MWEQSGARIWFNISTGKDLKRPDIPLHGVERRLNVEHKDIPTRSRHELHSTAQEKFLEARQTNTFLADALKETKIRGPVRAHKEQVHGSRGTFLTDTVKQ
jgi:hypothetical protein